MQLAQLDTFRDLRYETDSLEKTEEIEDLVR